MCPLQVDCSHHVYLKPWRAEGWPSTVAVKPAEDSMAESHLRKEALSRYVQSYGSVP